MDVQDVAFVSLAATCCCLLPPASTTTGPKSNPCGGGWAPLRTHPLQVPDSRAPTCGKQHQRETTCAKARHKQLQQAGKASQQVGLHS